MDERLAYFRLVETRLHYCNVNLPYDHNLTESYVSKLT